MTPTPAHPSRNARLRAAAALLAALCVAGCTRAPAPASAAELARIRAACPPGSFVAAMAANCPTVAPR